MARNDASPKQTAGGAFDFENEVVAYFLAYMLAGRPPLEHVAGLLTRLDVQEAASEWHLDDIVLTLAPPSGPSRVAFSVKSNTQFGASSFPSDFVRDAWEQLLHTNSDVFDESRDFLGLITAPVSRIGNDVHTLLARAREQDPADLGLDLNREGRANDRMRGLYKSAVCPVDLANGKSELMPGRLLRRVLWLSFDLEHTPSERRRVAKQLCQDVLCSGMPADADTLWEALKEISWKLRKSSGDIDRARLVGLLRSKFRLSDFPDHRADWERLSEDAQAWINRVRTTIGGSVELPWNNERASIHKAFSQSQSVVLIGESGAGKTGIAGAEARSALARGPILWAAPQRLDTWTLAKWRSGLGLVYSLSELASAVPKAEALLVLDSLDRLYSVDAFDAVAELIRVTQIGQPESPWRMLVTCTPEAWGRVQSELTSRQVQLEVMSVVNVTSPAPEELDKVWKAFPELALLKDREHIAPILRPKVLDLLATNRSILGDATRFGESDVARLFWDREVAPQDQGVGRAHAARRLAILLADRLRPALLESSVLDTLDGVSPDALDALEHDRILVRVGGTISFAHDLYADWVRAQTLRDEAESGTLAAFLSARTTSPVWHRALRLLGIDLLEQGGDHDAWRRVYDVLQEAVDIDEADRPLLGDALLESLAFSVKAGIGLLRDDVWPFLSQDDGYLLMRLLRRLQVSATVTDRVFLQAVLTATSDPEAVRVMAQLAQVPFWQYWYGILSLLHMHRDEIPRRAAGDAAKAVDVWLRQTAPDFPFRAEAARVAVSLGEALLKEKESSGRLFMDGEPDQAVYRAVLAAGREEADAVTQILLEAAGRREHRFVPPPPSEEEQAARKESTRRFPPSFIGRGTLIGPYPCGPVVRVDGALQKAVWSLDALRPLCEALPDVARELLLATLISATRRVSHRSNFFGEYGLEWPNSWNPTFYTQGPFLGFLQADEEHAVTAILQLLQHATERWVDNGKHYAQEKGLVGPLHLPTVEIWVEGEWKPFTGDGNVFGWNISGPGHGNVISVALQALEKHLYDRIDSGADISELLVRLLRDGSSLAILGVLTLVLQRHPDLASGPLRGLVASPEIAFMVKSRAETTQSPMGQWLWWTGLTQLPRFLHSSYEEWHTMPHRASPHVVDLASLVAYHPELASFFDQVRDWLQVHLKPDGRYHGWDIAERIAVMLDRSNYFAATGPNGEPAVVYKPPEEWARRHQEAQLTEFQENFVDNLPALAAQAYGHLGSREVDVDTFLDAITPDVPGSSWMGRDEVEIARAALCLHPTMGSHSPDRLAWARQRILDASESPDATPGLYSVVGNMLRPPVVLPRVVIALLARDPADKAARTAVARHLRVSPLHDLVALAETAKLLGSDLGDDHIRVAHALMRRAAIDHQLSSAEQNIRFAEIRSSETEVEELKARAAAARRELQQIEDTFVAGSLSPALPDLNDLALLQPPQPANDARRRAKPYRPVNADILSVALMAFPAEGLIGSPWHGALVRYAEQTFGPLEPAAGQELTGIDGLPDSWQKRLLEHLGEVAIALSDPDAAEAVWKPVLNLGAVPRGWIDPFAFAVTKRVVVPEPDPVALETWRRMIRFALDHPAWAPGLPETSTAHNSGSSWRSLLGLSSVVAVLGWTSDLRPTFDAIHSELMEWADSYLVDSTSVGWFAGVLANDAFATTTLPGLQRLAAAAVAHPNAFWGRVGSSNNVESHVTSLLTRIWTNRRAELRAKPDLREAFNTLLRTLVTRQHTGALRLADEIREIGL